MGKSSSSQKKHLLVNGIKSAYEHEYEFEHDGEDYHVTVDYFSSYWEIARLENTKSSTVVKKKQTKKTTTTITNKTQVTLCSLVRLSASFMNFSKEWGFECRTTNPYKYNRKANGKAESAV